MRSRLPAEVQSCARRRRPHLNAAPPFAPADVVDGCPTRALCSSQQRSFEGVLAGRIEGCATPRAGSAS